MRKQIVTNATESAKLTLSLGFAALEVVIADFGKKTEETFRSACCELPQPLAQAAGETTFESEREVLRTALDRKISAIQAARQNELRTEFAHNRSREFDRAVQAAKDTLE
jgi:hypothetical protein